MDPILTPDRLLRSQDAAKRLAATVADVWALNRRGKLPHVTLGPGVFRFRESDVARLIREGVRG